MKAEKIYWKQGFYEYPIKDGVEISLECWQELIDGQANGKCIVEDSNGYPILTDPEPVEGLLTYEELVEIEIRKRYSVSNELAILRQRDSKPIEFTEYYDFCEDVKQRMREGKAK